VAATGSTASPAGNGRGAELSILLRTEKGVGEEEGLMIKDGPLRGSPPDAPIVVKEVPCVKAGCPPVETALMVFLKNEPPRTFKILARVNEVTFDHVYNLIENPLPCC